MKMSTHIYNKNKNQIDSLWLKMFVLGLKGNFPNYSFKISNMIHRFRNRLNNNSSVGIILPKYSVKNILYQNEIVKIWWKMFRSPGRNIFLWMKVVPCTGN